MIHLSTILQHYKREDVQEEILANAQNKEIAVKYADKGFGKRPDVLQYGQDILELAKKGATSLHASEELWINPLRLDTTMKRRDIDELRSGWDLVLDIDCKFLEYSKVAADLVIKALKFYGIKSISCKFSGNKGFHIGVPFEAFPKKIGNRPTKELFPEAPRKIAFYLKHLIKKPLGERILKMEKGDFSRILEKTGKKEEEIKLKETDEYGAKTEHLDVESFLDIDTILISSRHLYRMPYSFHEKSGLISVPINPEKVLEFDKEMAKHPVKVSKYRFLDKDNVEKAEAKRLMLQSYDFNPKAKEEFEIKKEKDYELPSSPLDVKYFPPCIKLGLKGLSDGRKRFLFALTNFLVNVGWDYDKIEKLVTEWNKRNDEPLRDTYVLGHLRYHKTQKKKIPPPNCNNMMYYVDIRICKPDNLCGMIKNPLSYTKRKTRFLKEEKKKSPKQNPS